MERTVAHVVQISSAGMGCPALAVDGPGPVVVPSFGVQALRTDRASRLVTYQGNERIDLNLRKSKSGKAISLCRARTRTVGDVEEFTLENVVIDNYYFGVSSLSETGVQSPVVFPGPAGAF